MLYEDNLISSIEWETYNYWFDTFKETSTVNLIIYIKTSPSKCLERINIRNRSEESNIKQEYLNKCNKDHNDWLDVSTQNIITIDGDGTGAVLKANVSGGKIQNIVIQNRGNYYTYANLTFTDVSGGIGTLAAAEVSIAPHNGHGYEPTYELGGSTIMFNVEFDEDEGGVLPVDNDFREVVILRNPYLYNTTTLATGQKYSLYTLVKVSPGVGDFNNDEVVYQGTTYASATFTADVISFSETPNLLYLNNVRGTLQTNQAIRGLQTGAIRIVNTVTNPTLDLYSGKILYISDKLPITRDPAQTERIRFILSF
jgi:hypothetical protein